METKQIFAQLPTVILNEVGLKPDTTLLLLHKPTSSNGNPE